MNERQILKACKIAYMKGATTLAEKISNLGLGVEQLLSENEIKRMDSILQKYLGEISELADLEFDLPPDRSSKVKLEKRRKRCRVTKSKT